LLRSFFSLTKPGIIFGNLITACGGFFLAEHGHFNFILFISMVVGVSLVIASGCVFNNYIDQDIDQLMYRTRNRPLVKGEVSGIAAIIFAIILGVCGLLSLYYGANLLCVIIALIGLFVYVGVYSLSLKRVSIYGTLVGSISGAVPPVIGYCAVTNSFDAGALILFLMLSLWQMPHSFAIAIYRFEDYKSANIPVLPVRKSMRFTKISMLIYTIAFGVSSLMLYIMGYASLIYLAVASIIALRWLYLSFQGFYATNDKLWARRMFLFSILGLTILCFEMSVDFLFVKL
jgi:protoheme IX farnesyltransferase